MMQFGNAYALLMLMLIGASCDSTSKSEIRKETASTELYDYQGPQIITRTIKQGSNGDIWIAAFDGVFRYNGNSFANITSQVSSARFFSLLEDSNGVFWFGSIGSGVYRYDGQSFQNITTLDGLVSNEIVCIYEDAKGNIWFGANGGVSRYDGASFRNYVVEEDTMIIAEANPLDQRFNSEVQQTRIVNEVNSIIEDATGKLWFGTRGSTFVFDGSTFVVQTYEDKPFTNVRWIIEDKSHNIWLGGNDGLSRFDGDTHTIINENFTGYIYEDNAGNVWTTSQNAEDLKWVLSRYDKKTLHSNNPRVVQIKSEYDGNKGMMFGILETRDGVIWIGGLDGVYCYDGNRISSLNNIPDRD